LITRVIAIVPAYIVILYYGEGKTGALLVLSQVVLSLQLGFAVVPLIHFVSDKEKMGKFVIKTFVKIAAWLIAGVIVALNVKLVLDEVSGWLATSSNPIVLWLTVVPIIIGAGGLLLYITLKPLFVKRKPKSIRAPHGTVQELDISTQPVYERIAISIDFSASDGQAINSAINQGGTQAEYLLIHITESVGAIVMGSEIDDFETGSDKANLKLYAEQLRSKGYKVQTKVGYGNPKKKIPELTKEFNADLLVMGVHGHKLLKDLIFGTTVGAVRHRVDIPLFIVRAGKKS
jgi:manganese transport protein